MEIIAILSVAAAVIGLIAAVGLAAWIKQADEGNDRMKEIAGYIREGAMAFLKREYRIMAIVIIVIALLIGIGLQSVTTAILYSQDRFQIGSCNGSRSNRTGTLGTRCRCMCTGSGYCYGVHNRLWIRSFVHGSVRKGRRRYLHQGC